MNWGNAAEGDRQWWVKGKRIVQTRIYRAALARLTPELLTVDPSEGRSAKDFGNVSVPVDVVVHFADPISRVYQLEQWLPVFERLHERWPTLILTRNLGTFRHLTDVAKMPLLYARRLSDVHEALDETDPKLCLYVNNSNNNFNVLSWHRALHVHLNHGESDKVSMASNQAKAYDYVFVAGEAAELRYKNRLLAFDDSKLVRVGRPQLDLNFDRALPPSSRLTVLYAPTWEGDVEEMNYTSVEKYGEAIVRSLVHDGYRVVYKPHPRVVTGSARVASAHRKITGTLEAANRGAGPGDGHVVELGGSILSLFSSCDVLVTDVSSVALDWLYLRTDAPVWICDPRNDRDRLVEASPLAARTHVLDRSLVPHFASSLRNSLARDAHREDRDAARRLYFGDIAPGDSMKRFEAKVGELASRRDALLANKDSAQATVEPVSVASSQPS